MATLKEGYGEGYGISPTSVGFKGGLEVHSPLRQVRSLVALPTAGLNAQGHLGGSTDTTQRAHRKNSQQYYIDYVYFAVTLSVIQFCGLP